MRSRVRAAVAACVVTCLIALPGVAERRVVNLPGSDLGLPFSPAVWHRDLLFLSGAIGNRPGTLELAGGVVEQTRQTVANLRSVLAAAELDLDRVVSADMYLTDLREFPEFWSTLRAAMPGPVPAGAAVEAGIAIPDARLEMAFVAARKGVEIRRLQPEGWPSADGGSWGVMAGDVLFVSGMASFDPETGAFVPGDVASQTRRTMRNLEAVLESAGLGWGDLTRCRVFLPDPRDFAAMNEAYGAFMTEVPPARATVQGRLLHPEAKIGVQCTATRDAGRRAVRARGATPSSRPFSPSIEAGGRLYLAGMVGRGAAGYPHGVAAQTRIALTRLQTTLEAAGLSFEDVLEATVYLSDARYYAAMNEVYAEVVGAPPPARATVAMPLMSPEALVEIQMTAAGPTGAGEAHD